MRMQLGFDGCRSLKEKRQRLRKLVDRCRHKFNIAIAETGHLDNWQRGTIGFAAVGNNERHVQSVLDHVSSFIEQAYVAQVLGSDVDLLRYNDDEPMSPGVGGGGAEDFELAWQEEETCEDGP